MSYPECDQEISEIRDLHQEMETKFRDILLYKKSVEISDKDKMFIYSKVVKSAGKQREENAWKHVNLELYNYYKNAIKSLLEIKKKDIDQTVGRVFLVEVSKTWQLMKIFSRWNITLFQPIEKYTNAYYSTSLPQAAIEILRDNFVVHYKDKIKEQLFKEFHKEREHDQVDTA